MQKHVLPITGLIAAALMFGMFLTWNGVNHHYDAAWYLVYARGLIAGDGFSVPISSATATTLSGTINQWPPLYPLVMALGGNTDLYRFARWLTVGLLICAVLLTYWLALLAVEGRRIPALIAALLALTVPALGYDGFSFARSETLFTVLALAFALTLTPYRPSNPNAPLGYAALAAVLLAALIMTRYVGVAFGVLGVGWMAGWAWRSGGGWRRWLPIGMFALAGVPLVLYAFYLRGVTGSFTGTQTTADEFSLRGAALGIETLTIETLHGLSFAFRVVGLRSNFWGLLAALVLVGLLMWWVRQRGHHLHELLNGVHGLLLAYLAAYCAVFWLMGARSEIITEQTPRHYVVVYPVVMVLVVSVLSRINAPRVVWGGLVGLYLISGLVAAQLPAAGLLYNSPAWRTDPLLASLPERLPPETLLHTQYTSHLSMIVGRDVPVRTFGSINGFNALGCDALVYPEPYPNAAFTLIDSAYVRQTPPAMVESYLREWAAPCGEVIDYENNGFTVLMVVRLRR